MFKRLCNIQHTLGSAHFLVAVLSGFFVLTACSNQKAETPTASSEITADRSANVSTSQITISLNGDWNFRTDPNGTGLENGWHKSDVNISGWDTLPVPGVWDTINEYAIYTGSGWYTRTFEAPSNWKGKRINLNFESVYDNSEVWLNGKKIAENDIGYLPFDTDIEDALKYGQTNRLTVRTDNLHRVGAIWSWGGIRRPVTLEITDPVRLDDIMIGADPDLSAGTAEIDIRYTISNTGTASANTQVKLTIDRDGDVIWEGMLGEDITTASGGTKEHRTSVNLPAKDVALWHFNDPNLYNATVSLLKNDEVIQNIKTRFGIRKIEIDGLEFKLNGEAIRTVGFNVVAEDRVNGNTLPMHRIKEDVDMMKKLGANMARVSHLPLPKDYLDYLDEQGIMTLEEVSLWGEDVRVDPDHPQPKEWLDRMIRLKYNHPSIIGWSVGNEIGRPVENPKIDAYIKGAVEYGQALDPTRFVNYVTHSTDESPDDASKYVDFIWMNEYSKWGERVATTHKHFPGKPIFYSEYGSSLYGEELDGMSADFPDMLGHMRGRPYLMGASAWTFNDYRSVWDNDRPAYVTAPSQNRSWGVVNVHRQAKDTWHIMQNEHAPVREMELSQENERWSVKLSSRRKLDLPAYKMDGYILAWTTRDVDGAIIKAGSIAVPEINPGDEAVSLDLDARTDGSARLTVELLDPLGNPTLERRIDFEAPTAPNLVAVHTGRYSNDGLNIARVVFDPVPNATSYILKYGQDGLTQTSKPTIQSFIDVDELPYGVDYDFAVIAVNEAGESKPSRTLREGTDSDLIPPAIWKTTPADRRFSIGYTTDRTDYLYEVKYGTEPGKYDHHRLMRVPGVGHVRGLENDKTYYYILRRRYQSGWPSQWTSERQITPRNAESKLEAPKDAVLNMAGVQPVLFYTPVELSAGYQLSITSHDGDKQTIDINTAYSGRFLLPELTGKDIANARISTRNDAGFLGEVKSVKILNP